MIGVDDQAAPAAMPPRSDVPAPVSDPVSHLSAVYRDYPGLRALILRRVRDPELAADILQDAAVTTLEKLRRGEIAHPENLGGYLYRVALNHLRNHRHFNRVIFRARNRFRELLEQRGFWKADLLTLVAIGLILGHAGQASDTRNSATAPANPSIQGGVQ
ncbi:MAG: hypothetical protein E6K50_08875 [Gammaproteobacteria bacterium]|nr:MAG: hypothetical protein E6K50_08875 [Gammaproteobacteria bacterium]